MNPFQIVWQSMKTLYDELFRLFLMGFVTLLALLLILPGPLALAGLWGVAQRAVAGQSLGWSDYWKSIKCYGPRNWLNTLVTLVVYGLLALNLRFYNTPGFTPVSGNIALAATIFWLGVTAIWTGTVFYWLSFQLEMTEPKYWYSLRNSLYLVLARPWQTLILVIAAGLGTVLCAALPLLLALLPGLIAVLSLTGLKELVRPLIRTAQTENDETSMTVK